jgi:hypothetical protein
MERTSRTAGSTPGVKVRGAVVGLALVASLVALAAAPAGAAGGSGTGELKALGGGVAVLYGQFDHGTIRGNGVFIVVDPEHDLQVDVEHYTDKVVRGAVTWYLGWSGAVHLGHGGAIVGAVSDHLGLDVAGHGGFRLEGRGFWDSIPGGAGVWGTHRFPAVGSL